MYGTEWIGGLLVELMILVGADNGECNFNRKQYSICIRSMKCISWMVPEKFLNVLEMEFRMSYFYVYP